MASARCRSSRQGSRGMRWRLDLLITIYQQKARRIGGLFVGTVAGSPVRITFLRCCCACFGACHGMSCDMRGCGRRCLLLRSSHDDLITQFHAAGRERGAHLHAIFHDMSVGQVRGHPVDLHAATGRLFSPNDCPDFGSMMTGARQAAWALAVLRQHGRARGHPARLLAASGLVQGVRYVAAGFREEAGAAVGCVAMSIKARAKRHQPVAFKAPTIGRQAALHEAWRWPRHRNPWS